MVLANYATLQDECYFYNASHSLAQSLPSENQETKNLNGSPMGGHEGNKAPLSKCSNL